ncbi:RelA/SpoT domain-containing protein [Microbulbifer halophilus]|uniref:RelA/SpoT domain-containing protein n=1 Tax=Microbulbifer halophilus TaxID=453963 RepID=A0ABW5EEE7_9GAMM|nr:RelA/SpoT domain-containing protein [Microbulbifer halophilus]MCW8127756.1 RelA/SpoT domain-containing protein [Microbulbifer halophilus]
MKKNIEGFELFQKHVKNFFESRSLSKYVHSVRHRIKDVNHFLDKIERKNNEDESRPEEERKGLINSENVFTRVTDIAGIRVLHLHISEFEYIHRAIMEKINDEEFTLYEDPKAYTWDPESGEYFESLGLKRELKESYYTSIHYVLRPNSRSHATCEVQIRTLLEEVWGEIDHTMNYPEPSTDSHCKEQIRVLARLVGAGTHLADSIMRRYGDKA